MKTCAECVQNVSTTSLTFSFPKNIPWPSLTFSDLPKFWYFSLWLSRPYELCKCMMFFYFLINNLQHYFCILSRALLHVCLQHCIIPHNLHAWICIFLELKHNWYFLGKYVQFYRLTMVSTKYFLCWCQTHSLFCCVAITKASIV